MDLYDKFNQHYNLLIDEYRRNKSSKNVQNKFITELINTVNINVSKLCLGLKLNDNFKYFYLYVLNLFIQNLANAMVESLKRAMTNSIIEYITNLKTQENPDEEVDVNDDDITIEIQRFEKKINYDIFKQMYNTITNIKTNDCYNYIAVICFIAYLETNTFEFIDTLANKIVSGETSINLEFNNNINLIILPVYTESNNNFCINCFNCSNCLCCYECTGCKTCNCCINCIDCSQSMYCMNSLNINNSFYVNNSNNIFYCHKCCNCKNCYYSDHVTNCFNIMYVSNVTNLINNQKSFIQPTFKYLDIDNRKNVINCFQRRINMLDNLTNDSIAESTNENIFANDDLSTYRKISQLNVYYPYTQIIKRCNKQLANNNYDNTYTDVTNNHSLIYGCNYPISDDVYFKDDDFRYRTKWNDTQLSYCSLKHNKNMSQCQNFLKSKFNPLNKNNLKRPSFQHDNKYYKRDRTQ